MNRRNFFILLAAGSAASLSYAEPGGLAMHRHGGFAAGSQGELAGASARGFSTASGGQGLRVGKVQRQADGSASASMNASATTSQGGTYERQGTYSRDAQGNGTAQRSTQMTNAQTGVTMDASRAYTSGSGVSRSATCHDASGNTVSCGSR
ncbi:hypothetical protein EZ313_04570 [Ramlibacter henchirensis]|uniref:Uncharacterized protein n=1 Tax=Ramlibacter henchirensis TaxID=204072 RepID=A0A4Z0C3Y3_9BURK|nr:hypothetical protein [Ramlibacter henchirensis]TFZ05931.1 hypothetical protein EZ313_04570 [Ramlibacter henchirensis]